MQLKLLPAHRMAQTNYPIRVGSFGYSFVVFVAVCVERGTSLSAAALAFPLLALLIYPHLAYLHARLVSDSRNAELNNLLADAVLLGLVTAQTGVPLWLFGAVLMAICINNAVCGGSRRLVVSLLLLCGTTVGWSVLRGTPFVPQSGPIVTLLCLVGMAAYVTAVGLVMHGQTDRLITMRNALAQSQAQFRFIAEHAGDYVTVLDSRGRIRYVSGAYQERFDPNLIRNGQHWTGLVMPEDRERARNLLTSILRSGRGARLALNFAAANGTVIELECAANLIEEAGLAGSHLLVVTSRRRTGLEQAMEGRFSRELMRHHASYGLLITSLMGRIELASPRMGEMLGYAAGELLGKTIDEIAEAIPSSDSLIDDVWRAVEIDGVCQRKFLAIDRTGKLKLAWANVVALRGEEESPRYAWTIVDDPALTITPPEAQAGSPAEAKKNAD